MSNAIFVDWITITQHHPKGGLPLLLNGLQVWYDREGNACFERASPSRLSGSYDTSLQVRCDGFFVSLSGNVGRYGRKDNLFNLGFRDTISKCNRIMLGLGLPAFGVGRQAPVCRFGIDEEQDTSPGARISRLDITCNFCTGSESQARAVVKWLSSRSVSRMRKGAAGDESVWWANTRHMLKAYVKSIEMLKHGADSADEVFQWVKQQGVLRIEVELKKRLLSDLGLNRMENITDEILAGIFEEQTQIFRSVDRSDEPDILDALPPRSRVYASAWLAGRDLRTLVSNGTLYNHAKILKEYGIDILQPRNVDSFPVRVRVVDLQALEVPEWYNLQESA